MRAAYDALVALHVVCAVVGFGAVALSGAYGTLGRRLGNEEELKRYFSSPGRAEYLILVVPVFGIAALAARPGGGDFGQGWVVAGFAIWVVASVLLLRVVRPAEAKIRSGNRRAASPLMWAAGACDVLFVAALFLMVTQPGGS